jgi:hypothetical protein
VSFEHPRFRIYPQHVDYYRMRMQFRPYVMAIHEPNYRSPSVNTDQMGLRVQYGPNGVVLEWDCLKRQATSCRLLLGNSSAFCVDASSDKSTLSHFLNMKLSGPTSSPAGLVLNLGVRGATSAQELLLFHFLKRFLPPVDDVVLFTGIILPTMVYDDTLVFYPEWGGVISEEYFRASLLEQQRALLPPPNLPAFRNMLARLAEKLQTSAVNGFVKLAADFYFGRLGQPGRLPTFAAAPKVAVPQQRDAKAVAQRYACLLDQLRNDLDTWRLLSAAGGFKVHYVLQPALGWTAKKLSDIEERLFRLDIERNREISLYATPAFHKQLSSDVGALCADSGIDFHDANAWLGEETYAGQDLFADLCHLNDDGNRHIATLVGDRLRWKFCPTPG